MGAPVDFDYPLRIVSSWGEALAFARDDTWSWLHNEAVNMFCRQIFSRDKERWDTYNEVIHELRPKAIELTERKIAPLLPVVDEPKELRAHVRWDVLHILAEVEFADVFPPAFFKAQAGWYQAGHFPCGLIGEFPKGTRVIF